MKTENAKTKTDTAEHHKRVMLIQRLPAQKVVLGEAMEQSAAKKYVQSLQPITNERDGRTVLIPGRTIGKLFGHQGYGFSKIIKDIAQLYKTSVWGWFEHETPKEGHKQHNNLTGYHNYINKFTDGNGEYYIRFTISEEKARHGGTGRSLIHSAAISNSGVYKKGDRSQRISIIGQGGESPSPFIDKKLQNFFLLQII